MTEPHEAIGLTLPAFLARETTPGIAALINAIAETAIGISLTIRQGHLAGALGADTGAVNLDGDSQKTLDVLADEAFSAAIEAAGAAAILSEELEAPRILREEGGLVVAIDPLDGSSNIDTNVSIGTIFSILPATASDIGGDRAFLRPGHAQVAAGFVIYGPQTSLVFTTGTGTHMATLDPLAGSFRLTRHAVLVPEGSPEFAINASNYRHWHPPIQAYIDDCVEGDEGPRGKNFNMRWIASLVADAYRIIVRGGVFLYPADNRRGYERGRLRHLYEANPIAFLVEQAGGAATDGVNRILDAIPSGLHVRIPFIFGSFDKVERVRRYHLGTMTGAEQSPLFGRRGLLRA
ncbi:class 1 fructose-bisphosphatase [Rhabdaerophilum sp. SD176]|uniref:class 1 fructose-bisphosphatase n=1 Tax=Rhabdaerophilum sp. SD176 TaxID=2983548 RepID=UPI0024DF6492|nr:class 1 fructose-bisphosphatase [Rhabdaerophilum sp. SD176]